MTAGYIDPRPGAEFFAAMDAANVDLERRSPSVSTTRSAAATWRPVLDTLQYIRHAGPMPAGTHHLADSRENDSEAELDAMTAWVVEHLG